MLPLIIVTVLLSIIPPTEQSLPPLDPHHPSCLPHVLITCALIWLFMPLSTALLIHYEALKAKAMLHVFLTLFPIPSQAAGKIQAAALLLSASPPPSWVLQRCPSHPSPFPLFLLITCTHVHAHLTTCFQPTIKNKWYLCKCMAESLHCSSETITTLLTRYNLSTKWFGC